jgi:hypothetical protein
VRHCNYNAATKATNVLVVLLSLLLLDRCVLRTNQMCELLSAWSCLSLDMADGFLEIEIEKQGLDRSGGNATSILDPAINSDDDTVPLEGALPLVAGGPGTLSEQTEGALVAIRNGVSEYLIDKGDVTIFSFAKSKALKLLGQQRDILESAVSIHDDPDPKTKERASQLERSLLMTRGLTLFSTLACAGRVFTLRACNPTLSGAPIEAVVLDEACQATEVSATALVIPLPHFL